LQLATAAFSAGAEIWIQVGESSDSDSVFNPQTVTAALNDIVFFNFTNGNHTVTQSLFASPCVKANAANLTVNGFDSGFQNASTIDPGYRFSVPITAAIENTTQWFFDYNTCGEGGVGGINVNESSWETLDGFVRNADRLNGSDSTSSQTSTSRTQTSGSPSSTSSSGSGADGAAGVRASVLGAGAIVLPIVVAGLFL
ncbi:hypothetical protein CYLTODRAFT_351994, partial [Cylindrobasidium torrendii FP15055 ss-10]